MNVQSPTVIYRKLGELERELQRLKVEAYFALPPRKRISPYLQRDIVKALRNTRRQIWRDRYAKNATRFS